MHLPWGAPDQLILPGFHTPAEDGLRGRQTGDEMMLATCGLMASGVRTMLLDGESILQQGPELAVLAGWCAATFALALRIFRWE